MARSTNVRDAKIFSGESEFWSDIERGLEAEIKGMLYGDELPEIAEVTGTFSLGIIFNR